MRDEDEDDPGLVILLAVSLGGVAVVVALLAALVAVVQWISRVVSS